MDESKITKSASNVRRPPAAGKSRSPKIEAADPSTTPERLTELADQSVELARLVAQNPSAPEQLLIKLSRSHDVSIRRSLAGNPSTPLDVLHSVGKKFPKELLKNPALNLLLLENPNLLREFPSSILSTLLKQDDCPMGVLTQAVLVEDEEVLLAICRHAGATPEMMQRLQASTYTTVRTAASLHVSQTQTVRNWQEQLQATVVEILRQAMPTQRLRFLPLLRAASQLLTDEQSSADTSPPAFYSIVEDLTHTYSDAAVLERHLKGGWYGLLANPLFPVAMLERLANDDNWKVRQAIASSLSTPVIWLERLANDEDYQVRQSVARNLSTPVPLLEQLASDVDYNVCLAVASNPSISVTGLGLLASNKEYCVRFAVAMHSSTPVSILERLASDEVANVCLAVAKHPSTPFVLFERVREQLAHGANKKIFMKKTLEERQFLAESSATPISIFKQLATDKDRAIRLAVAKNSKTSPGALERLVSDRDVEIRRAVAENPATSVDLLEKLVAGCEDAGKMGGGYTNQPVLRAVNLNPSLPVWLLERLVSIENYEHLTTHTVDGPGVLEQLTGEKGRWLRSPVGAPPPELMTRLEYLASSDKWLLRLTVAENPSTPTQFLERLANDEHYRVRQAVARNPSTPGSVLEWLACDEDNDVREAINYGSDSLARLTGNDSIWLRSPAGPPPPELMTRLEYLASSDKSPLRVAIARHPATPIQLLEKLAMDESESVRHAIASNPVTPPWHLERLAEDESSRVRSGVARNSSTPFHIWERLACDKDSDVSDVFGYQSETLEQLTGDEGRWLRYPVGAPPVELMKRLEHLTSSDKYRLRVAVAWHPATPIQLLEKLAEDKAEDVRNVVAMNPSTPPWILERLAEDESTYVRIDVAQNLSTPLHILERLACDVEYRVQCAFSDGPGLLEQLTGEDGRWLRSPVGEPPQELMSRLEYLTSSDKSRLRAAVACHPATPIKLLERLAEDENSDVRQAVANNPSASIHLLERLKEKENESDGRVLWKWATCETIPKWLGISTDDDMRRTIDGSPAITAYILGRLAAYSGEFMWSIRRDVLRNRALPLATLECSLQDRDNAVVQYASKYFRKKEIDLSPPCQLTSDERALMAQLLAWDAQNITNSDSPSPARLLALLSPWAPEEALAKSSRSTWWEERAAIAANPKTPAATRAKLAEDGNTIVRAAARAHAR